MEMSRASSSTGITGMSFEIRCGRRLVSFEHAHTGRDAIIEYLRSMGCRDSEMSTVAANALDWGGAVYRAVPLGSEG